MKLTEAVVQIVREFAARHPPGYALAALFLIVTMLGMVLIVAMLHAPTITATLLSTAAAKGLFSLSGRS